MKGRKKLYSIEDPIVLEGIRGINKAKEINQLKGHIAGGMAVQSYLPSEINRKTVDLDFRLLWGGVKKDFDRIMIPLIENFEDNGYYVEGPKKRDVTYEIFASKGSDSLVLQHQRASPNNFEKNKKNYEREMANQRIIKKGDVSYAVLSPEDIVTHKLSRVLNFNDNYGLTYPSNFHEFSAERILQNADDLRAGVIERIGLVEPKEVAKMRVLYDCVDIKNLSRYAGLNEKYLLESFESFEELTNKEKGTLQKGLSFVGIDLSK